MRKFLRWVGFIQGQFYGAWEADYIRAEDLPRPDNLVPGTYFGPVLTIGQTGQITAVTGTQASTTIYGWAYDPVTATATPITTPPSGGVSRLFTYTNSIPSQNTTETDFYVSTIPAGTLAANNDVIVAEYSGTLVGSVNPKVVRFYIDGTEVYDSGNAPVTFDGQFGFRTTMIRVDATTIRASFLYLFNGDVKQVQATYTTDSTVTLANAFDVKMTGTGNTDGDITATNGYLEKRPA